MASDTDLGAETKQLNALRLRFDLHDSEDVEFDLPHHASCLYWCLECGRVPNACVDTSTRAVPHNEVGVSQTMLRVGAVGCASGIRCARRSSAALRTALQKEEDAKKHRIDMIDVTEGAISIGLKENGVSHAARLRRDVKSCAEQHSHALACGDNNMVKIGLIGKCVRIHAKWYAICSFCASFMRVDQSMRRGSDFCCNRCDVAMLNQAEPNATSPAAAKAVAVKATSLQDSTFQVVADSMLHCRFCGKPPPTTGSATKFKIVKSPNDSCGRNSKLPPSTSTTPIASRPG